MKGVMGADRQRNWSELGKEGRLLVLLAFFRIFWNSFQMVG